MKNLIITVSLIVTLPLLASEPQEAQIAKLKVEIEQLKKTIDMQEKTISRAEKGMGLLKKQLAEQQQENKRLLALCREHKIDTKQQGDKISDEKIADELSLPLKVGQIIYFENPQKFKVEQVIDSQNMIVEAIIRHDPVYGHVGESRFLTSSPVIGAKLIKRTIWIRGLNTSDYADGTIISPDCSQFFKITGTQSFDTLFEGIETLFVFEPYIASEKN